MRRWTATMVDASGVTRKVEVEAFDGLEATEAAAAAFGIDVVPCCSPPDEPCERCKREAEQDEADRVYDRFRDDALMRTGGA